jgi:hypothetical protein
VSAKRVKKNRKKTPTHATVLPEPQPLHAVLRALGRMQTRALIYEHAAEVVGAMFRGSDARPPSKLLAMPNGTRCRAEIEDVVEIEQELQRMAYAARVAKNALNRAAVIVDESALQRDVLPAGPRVPPPTNEGVADNPACRAAEAKEDAARRMTWRP